MKILETERLILREITERDAEFIFDLLNQPSFIEYIGNRNVDTVEQAREFIANRYRQSYREHGFGLYVVELKSNQSPIGICGFVKRETLPNADIGFALLPQFEGKGYAFESADAAMKYGAETLGFRRVLAVTMPHNERSGKLLEKLGFRFERLTQIAGSADEVKLFSFDQR